MIESAQAFYRGRLAPSPTGLLHLGHARTFWTAFERARAAKGILVLRNEDLDQPRCKPEFLAAIIEDLRWFGLRWREGPDCGGQFGPYDQSRRHALYLAAFETLRRRNLVFPCHCSRKDVLRSARAPHPGEDEPIYPGTCRPSSSGASAPPESAEYVSWRFQVPDGEAIAFLDGYYGAQQFVAGRDFGDFIVWRHDHTPSYQLAVVVDDAAMQITEVVRGADLLRSTARQLLLFRALGWEPPRYYHCPLMTDEHGVRLAKRHDALSLRQLRVAGEQPEQLRAAWSASPHHPVPERTGERERLFWSVSAANCGPGPNH